METLICRLEPGEDTFMFDSGGGGMTYETSEEYKNSGV